MCWESVGAYSIYRGREEDEEGKPESAVSILVGGGGKKGAAGVEWVGLEEPRTGLLGQFPGHLTEKTRKCIFLAACTYLKVSEA